MKKLTLGIIIAILLAVAIPAAAEEITKKVTATIRGDFAVQVDGEQVTLQNAPLAYNGNSYLPVRELATLLGKDVDFVDGVIKLDTPSKSPVEQYQELRTALEGAQQSIDFAEKTLEDHRSGKKVLPEDTVKNVEETLYWAKESYRITESKIAELLKQYPELAE